MTAYQEECAISDVVETTRAGLVQTPMVSL